MEGTEAAARNDRAYMYCLSEKPLRLIDAINPALSSWAVSSAWVFTVWSANTTLRESLQRGQRGRVLPCTMATHPSSHRSNPWPALHQQPPRERPTGQLQILAAQIRPRRARRAGGNTSVSQHQGGVGASDWLRRSLQLGVKILTHQTCFSVRRLNLHTLIMRLAYNRLCQVRREERFFLHYPLQLPAAFTSACLHVLERLERVSRSTTAGRRPGSSGLTPCCVAACTCVGA